MTATPSVVGTFSSLAFTLTLRAALDRVCDLECFDPAVDFNRCLGEENLAQGYESALCGQENGLYCFELYLKGLADSIIPTNDASCSEYNDTIEYLGCCAASLFRNPEVSSAFYPFSSRDFVNCYTDVDVAVGSRCLSPTHNDALQATGITETNVGESGVHPITKWILLLASIAVLYLSSDVY